MMITLWPSFLVGLDTFFQIIQPRLFVCGSVCNDNPLLIFRSKFECILQHWLSQEEDTAGETGYSLCLVYRALPSRRATPCTLPCICSSFVLYSAKYPSRGRSGSTLNCSSSAWSRCHLSHSSFLVLLMATQTSEQNELIGILHLVRSVNLESWPLDWYSQPSSFPRWHSVLSLESFGVQLSFVDNLDDLRNQGEDGSSHLLVCFSRGPTKVICNGEFVEPALSWVFPDWVLTGIIKKLRRSSPLISGFFLLLWCKLIDGLRRQLLQLTHETAVNFSSTLHKYA